MVNNATNINKTKESLDSDGQQCHEYQQNKRKFRQWWSWLIDISVISFQFLLFLLRVMFFSQHP
jgi:hypothetical protein